MPRGDGTGPMGMGSMTGRGAGSCANHTVPGYANRAGDFSGYGCGRGFGRKFCATGTPGYNRLGRLGMNRTYAPAADEKELLSRQAKFLENQLAEIKKRLSDTDGNSEG